MSIGFTGMNYQTNKTSQYTNYPFKVADWFLTWSPVKLRWAAVPGTWVTEG